MKNTRNFLIDRLIEVENMLDYSARVSNKVYLDDLDRHVLERLELLKERMCILSILNHKPRAPHAS